MMAKRNESYPNCQSEGRRKIIYCSNVELCKNTYSVGAVLKMLLTVIAAFQVDKITRILKMSGVTDFSIVLHGTTKVMPI